jgi:N-acetylmuramoyl-L-alanine amidase
MTKIQICLIVSFFFIFQIENAYSQNSQRTNLTKVVIDPGHGGRDSGAVGARSREKDIVLDIALRLGKLINEKYPDVEVIYTRKTDVFIELDKRSDIANKANADLFISIHCNAVGGNNRTAAGTETFVMGHSSDAANMEVARRENSVIVFEDDYSTRYQGFDPRNAESQIIFLINKQ